MKDILSVFILIIISITIISCSNEKTVAEVTREFENSDFNFNKRNQFFDINIIETKKPCKVRLVIKHNKGIDLQGLSFDLKITSPDGGEAVKLLNPYNYTKLLDESGTITTIEAYSEKYFNIAGDYKFQLYRRFEKFNLYGISSITIKISSFQPHK